MAVVLCILDGWGVAPDFNQTTYNPLISTHIQNYTNLVTKCPNTILRASEEAVGLGHGQMGNSEVGHYTIGAGRVVLQQLPRITAAIESGELENSPMIQDLSTYHNDTTKDCAIGQSCHLFCIISDGGVHGHLNHLLYLAKTLASKGIRLFLHLVTDGRDCPPSSAISYIQPILELVEKYHEYIVIATISGRYYAMDRDKRMQRTMKAALAIIYGKTENKFASPIEYITQNYAKGLTDEFIIPAAAENYHGFQNGDTFMMLNFRADRIRQIMHIISICSFDLASGSEIRNYYPDVDLAGILDNKNISLNRIITMSECDKLIDFKFSILFPKQNVSNCLGSIISENNLKQLRIAETEKYAHVTFFLNCGREDPYKNESRIMIPSSKVETYDLHPEMSANAITVELIKAIQEQAYDFICVNYANADMVGHTGNFAAALEACKTIDECLGELVEVCQATKTELIVTADHGNIEQMFDQKNNQPHTAHTLNPVPFIYVGSKFIDLPIQQNKTLNCVENSDTTYSNDQHISGLSVVAASVLELLDITPPKEMDQSIWK